MKKTILLFAFTILLMAGSSVYAQSFKLGVRGGMNIPNLTNGNSNNPQSSGYSSRLAADFAIFGEFRISKLFSIQPMIEYSEQGGKKNGLQAFPTPVAFSQYVNQPYVYADYKSTAHLNYLMVPILAKFGWNLGQTSPWRFYVDAGPFAGYLISAEQVTSGSSLIYMDASKQQPLSNTPQSFNNKEKIRDQLHHFNVGISGNIGLAYSFQNSSIFIEGGGDFGFVNIQKNPANGSNHTGAATITIGYAYMF